LTLNALKASCPDRIEGRYIEPFAGSACLFFDLQPSRAILGDLNRELICAMREIRRDVYRVLECARRLPRGKAGYYRVRSLTTSELCEAEIAARFIYLNRYCFNGLYRTNRQGSFNVPYGPPKAGKRRSKIDQDLIIRASILLQNASLQHADFENTLSQAKPGDFVYVDPPYAISDRRVFREYLPGSFSSQDLGRLARALESLDERGVQFLISYEDSPEAEALLGRWSPRRMMTRRNIAGFAGHRRSSPELVASNMRTRIT
jgi:DNA adenine methylase